MEKAKKVGCKGGKDRNWMLIVNRGIVSQKIGKAQLIQKLSELQRRKRINELIEERIFSSADKSIGTTKSKRAKGCISEWIK